MPQSYKHRSTFCNFSSNGFYLCFCESIKQSFTLKENIEIFYFHFVEIYIQSGFLLRLNTEHSALLSLERKKKKKVQPWM